MKVLLINGIFGSRSSGRSLADIKAGLEQEGNTVFVATPHRTDAPWHIQIGSRLDHKLHGLFSRVFGMQAYFSRLSTWCFLKKIDKIQPDIVHLQVIHGNFLCFPMVMKYLARKDIPAVFVLDDCWYFTGKCCHYTSSQCYKWQTGCHHCPRKKADNPSWFFDFSRKMYRDKKQLFAALPHYAVVAVSDWLKQEARRSYLGSAPILTRIYNSTVTEQFHYHPDTQQQKQALGLSGQKIVLGVATDWLDRGCLSKGLDLFLQLAAKLPENHTVVLIGHMPENQVLPHNVRSIDFVDGAEKLAEYYSMADVFVQMSSEETFGKVTAEALCCGTPVIVFDSTANPELVGPGCGYVVENRNIPAVLEKVLEATSLGRAHFADRCLSFALENFEAQKNVAAYLALYKQLLNTKED